jgi:hypothetical protein
MTRLICLPEKIITKIAQYLELKDIIELGNAHIKLSQCIYTQPAIWTKEILFPINNSSITDQFIKQIIPKITRHYGILEIQMVNLPLTWFGYFLIFDQFAHSLTSIRIQSDQIFMLLHHLTRFATHLATLQQDNQIPCTFREYAFEADQREVTVVIEPLPKILMQIRLDDPPFERLNHISITSQNTQQQDMVDQLNTIFSFLAGMSIYRLKRSKVSSPSPSCVKKYSLDMP